MNFKKILFLLLSLFSSLLIIGQPISNESFEYWTQKTHYEYPAGFSSSNPVSFMNNGISNAIKSTDDYSGDFALNLTTLPTNDGPLPGAVFIGGINGTNITGGTHYTQRPDSITGYAKFNVMENDTAYVAVLFKSNSISVPLGLCLIKFYGTQNSYMSFSAPVDWYIPFLPPDTLVTVVTSSTIFGTPVAGSTITIDDLQFVGATAPYPNGGFEDWVDFSSEEPDNWFTSNILNIDMEMPSVSKTDDSFEGDYAVRIENSITLSNDILGFITNGTLGLDGPVGGMQVNQIPDKLSGYYKYFPEGPDTAIAAITLYHSGNIIYESTVKLPAANEYTFFEITVDYETTPIPDTVNIALGSGNFEEDGNYVGIGSVLFADDLNITFKPPIGITTSQEQSDHEVYPNPASEKITIRLNEFHGEDMEITIVDSKGIVVYKTKFLTSTSKATEIDINNLSPGLYFYHLKNGITKQTGKFIVN